MHGPFEGREFYEQIEPILSEERWQKKIEDVENDDDFDIHAFWKHTGTL